MFNAVEDCNSSQVHPSPLEPTSLCFGLADAFVLRTNLFPLLEVILGARKALPLRGVVLKYFPAWVREILGFLAWCQKAVGQSLL